MTDTFEAPESEAPEPEGFEEEVDAPETPDEGEGEGEQPDPIKELERKLADKAGMAASERKKRQASERRRLELEERLEVLEAATRSAKPSPFAALGDVDVEGDPIGAIEKLAAVARSIQEANEAEEQTAAQQAKQSREMSKLSNLFASAEEEFSTEKPDYPKAREHLLKSLVEEVQAEGFDGQAAFAEASERFNQVVIRSLRGGRDAPEVVYTLAQRRGFGLDNGRAKLDLLRKGQQAGRSLGTAASSTGVKEISPAYVASLKGPAKLAAFNKLRDQELRKERRG